MSNKEIFTLLMCLKRLNSYYDSDNVDDLKNSIDTIINIHIAYLLDEMEAKDV